MYFNFCIKASECPPAFNTNKKNRVGGVVVANEKMARGCAHDGADNFPWTFQSKSRYETLLTILFEDLGTISTVKAVICKSKSEIHSENKEDTRVLADNGD
jgi:hypothetical protein